MSVVIAGGGTAGHVNPGIALAGALGDDVSFIGTRSGLEARLVPEAGHPFAAISLEGFDRARPTRLPLVAMRAAGAALAARRLLKKKRPSVVVGMGGYVSLPVCLAARSAGIPVVLHEQNIVLGLAHRVSKPIARKIGVSFEETLQGVGDKGVLTGNPVLPHIASLDRAAARAEGIAHFDLDPDRLTVIFFGGSLGARTLNQAAPAVARSWSDRDDVQVLHISGRRSDTSEDDGATDGYHVIDYTDRMDLAYAAADVAVCRGGATTVAELTAVGLPSIIVPYPFHRDRQQERHGRVLARAGAARVVMDKDATPDRLGAELDEMLVEETRRAMAAAARRLGVPDAAERLADVVRSVA